MMNNKCGDMIDYVNDYYNFIVSKYPNGMVDFFEHLRCGGVRRSSLPVNSEVGIFVCSAIDQLKSQHGIGDSNIVFNFLASKRLMGTDAHLMLAKDVNFDSNNIGKYSCANYVFSIFFEDDFAGSKCDESQVKLAFVRSTFEINKQRENIESTKKNLLGGQEGKVVVTPGHCFF